MDIGTLTGQIDIEDRLSGALSGVSNAVEQFGALFTGVAGTVVAAAAVAAAAIGTISVAIIELGNRGSDVNDVAATFENFSGSVDEANRSLKLMKAGTMGTVTDFDLMKSASKLLAADVKLTSDEFGVMSRAAFVLQNQGLGPTKDMLELVSQAMLTGRTRTLEMRLGKINLEKATKEYAKTLGVEVSQLNEAGKTEARRAAIMDLLNRKVQEAGEQQLDFGEKMDSVIVSIKNWGDELASRVAASPAVMQAIDSIGESILDAFGGTAESAIDNIISGIETFSRTVAYAAPIIIKVIGDIYKGFKDLFVGIQQYWNLVPDWMKTVASDAIYTAMAVQRVQAEMAKAVIQKEKFDAPVVSPGYLAGGAAAARARDEAANAALGYDKPVKDLIKSSDELIKKVETLRERVSGVGVQKEAKLWVSAIDQTGMSAKVLSDVRLRKELSGVLDIIELKFGSLENAGVGSLRGLQQAIKATTQFAETLPPAIIDVMSAFSLASISSRDWAEANKETTKTLLTMVAAGDAFKAVEIDFELARAKVESESFENQISKLADSFVQLAQVAGDSFGGIVKEIANIVVAWDTALQAAEAYKDTSSKVGKIAALAGGIGAIAQATGSGSTLGRTAGGALTGAAIGGAIGGPIGAGIGAAAGAITGLVRGLFSAGSEAKKLRKETEGLRQELFATSGGFVTLNQKALDAGVTLRNVLDARTPEAYKAAVEELNQAIQFQDSAMQLLDQTAQKYGITLAEMGDKYRQSKINEEFRILYQDTEVLKAAGVDLDLILRKQADSYKSLIQAAMDTGATIPQEMKSSIERMEELGLFVDEAGNKLFDLTKLNFAETLDQKFKTLIDTIGDLVQAIERGLGNAIRSIPQPQIEFPGPPRYEQPEMQEPSYYASGGVVVPFRPRGTDTVPAMLTPGERVIPRGGESGGTAVIELDGRTIARVVVPHIPGQVRRYGTGR